LTSLELRWGSLGDEGVRELGRSPQGALLRRLDLSFNGLGPAGAQALADAPLGETLTQLDLSGNKIGNLGLKTLVHSPRLGNLRRLDLWKCGITHNGVKSLLASPHLDRFTYVRLSENAISPRAYDGLRKRLGDRLYHGQFEEGVSGEEIVRRVKAEPPCCVHGLGAQPDTDLIRRFPHKGHYDADGYVWIRFQLTHPDPAQKAVLLGYKDTRGYNIFFSPYAIRWEPSGEQREFFDALQHGSPVTIVGSGERTPWSCGNPDCHDHTFIVTFTYRLGQPPFRSPDAYIPFTDQFYHFDLDAYCASQDKLIEVASFECK
jgi:hypothetical protein